MADKIKANKAYKHAKKLYFEKNDIFGAIKEMQESIRFDDDQRGEKVYQLAKLCIIAHKEEGIPKQDAAFAILAHQYFLAAKEKGKIVKEIYLDPINEIAKINYEEALKVYRRKKTPNYLARAAAYLKNSLALGGLPEGEVEYDLAKIYFSWSKKDKAYEYFQKAVSRGKKLTTLDDKFIEDYESNLGDGSKVVCGSEDVEKQIDEVKKKLADAEATLAMIKLKLDNKIPSEAHKKAVSELQSLVSNELITADLQKIEAKYLAATQDPSTFEYHIEKLTSVGVSPKVLLELTSGYIDLASGIDNLFWIRKLGGFQSPI